jgi:bile acid:Na+ symporter, BASS family
MLQQLLGITLVIFMAGNLLHMGLTLKVRDAVVALGNMRFLGLGLVWSFGVCPALAWLLTKVFPMPEPYAMGMLFLGLAPCAPFLPAVSQRAGGDPAYVAAFILMASVGTVITMPLAVPVLVDGFTADAWSIAKPLVFLVAIPLAVGIVIKSISAGIAGGLCPVVSKATAGATVLMLVLVLVIYRNDFVSIAGLYAIGLLTLYCSIVVSFAYMMGIGLSRSEKSVLALGVCTRNIGAAIAPLFGTAGTDRRAIAVCALAVPVTVIISLIAARTFAHLARKTESSHSHPAAQAVHLPPDLRKEGLR